MGDADLEGEAGELADHQRRIRATRFRDHHTHCTDQHGDYESDVSTSMNKRIYRFCVNNESGAIQNSELGTILVMTSQQQWRAVI